MAIMATASSPSHMGRKPKSVETSGRAAVPLRVASGAIDVSGPVSLDALNLARGLGLSLLCAGRVAQRVRGGVLSPAAADRSGQV